MTILAEFEAMLLCRIVGKYFTQTSKSALDGFTVYKWTDIRSLFIFLMNKENARIFFFCYENGKIPFAVFPHYVVLWQILFDELGFQKQSLDFRFCFDISNFLDPINEKVVSIRRLLKMILHAIS